MKKFISFVLVLLMIISTDVSVKAEETPEEVKDNKKISAYGTYEEYLGSGRVVSADIAWDDMTFTYKAERNGVWNPEKHEYEGAEVTGEWASETKSITVVNHSDCVINAKLTFDSIEGLGINGTFTEQSGTENDGVLELNTAIDTAYDQAPSATARFGISGNAITESKALGTITVAVEAVDLLDLIGKETSEYTKLISEYLSVKDAEKKGNVEVVLKLGIQEINNTYSKAIHKALSSYYDEDISKQIDLTIKDITTVAANGFSAYTAYVRELRLPNVTAVGEYAFRYCGYTKSFYLPKITKIGTYAFQYCENLESIVFNTNIESLGNKWLAGGKGDKNFNWDTEPTTANIVITIGSDQKDYADGSVVYPTKIGVGGTFGGYTFKEVKQAN